MKKSTIAIIIAVIAVLAIAGIVVTALKRDATNNAGTAAGDISNMSGQEKSSGNSSEVLDLTNQDEVTIEIKDFAFTKSNIKIKKGTTVTWVNHDTVKHNAFSDDSNGLKGELLGKGESYSFTFETVAVNNYYCTPHPYMKGIVDVVE